MDRRELLSTAVGLLTLGAFPGAAPASGGRDDAESDGADESGGDTGDENPVRIRVEVHDG